MRGRTSSAVLLAAAALGGCAADTWVRPGTGWSRASDLSVYGAMGIYAAAARDQAVLCRGFGPAGVEARWASDFAGRESAVAAALSARHGPAAVAEAAAERAVRQVPCREVPDGYWRVHYGRLLRLLETRLGLA